MVTQVRPRTLEDLITRFVRRPNLAPKSQDYYSNLLRNFAWYARSRGWPELITRDHIRDFLAYVSSEEHRWPEGRGTNKKASRATVHHYGKSIKAFFNWAEEEGYIDDNPVLRLKLGPPGYKEVEPYTDEEVYALLSLCESDARSGNRYLGLRNKAIISLFVATGLRLEELSRISLGSFDPRLQELEVMGKGSKVRVVPINGEARKALKGYLALREPGGEALWKTDDGEPLSMHSIQIMITRLKRRAGLAPGGGAHRFRHYFATRYLEAGGDINSLRLLLGHATLDMVLRYSRCVDVRKAIEGHEQFNPLDRLYNGGRNHNRWPSVRRY